MVEVASGNGLLCFFPNEKHVLNMKMYTDGKGGSAKKVAKRSASGRKFAGKVTWVRRHAAGFFVAGFEKLKHQRLRKPPDAVVSCGIPGLPFKTWEIWE
jgi:hypothetical protein